MPRNVVTMLALVLLTLLTWWGVGDHQFLTFDDPIYVSANPQVQEGVTASSLRWALTTGHAANWHPVTWISHLIDVELFGLDPRGHHLTNLLLHVVNVLLVLVLLQVAVRRWEVALATAALFAVHPIRIESVAWVAERKDVLSGTFWLLCIVAHTRAVQTGRVAPRVATVALLALGLATKPMLVTLPFLLLLWDRWPLRRPESWSRLVLEKAPQWGLVAGSIAVTLAVQERGGARILAEMIPWSERVANAAVSPLRLLAHLFWPADLAFFYPHPSLTQEMPSWSATQVAGAAAGLVGLTALAWAWRRRDAGVLTGWLWFLGTLVPVLGLVQVGPQAMADRYAYLPGLGVALAVVCLLDAARGRARTLARGLVLGAVVMAAVTTRDQLPHWRDSASLYQRALAIDSRNWMAHHNLGALMQDDPARARDHYRQALRTFPDYAMAHFNLGTTLLETGEVGGAIDHLQRAVTLAPGQLGFRRNLALGLLRADRGTEAAPHLRAALEWEPEDPALHNELALALLATDPATAMRHAVQACELSQHDRTAFLETRIMAHLRTGDLPGAKRWIDTALGIAARHGETAVTERLQELRNRLIAAGREEGPG